MQYIVVPARQLVWCIVEAVGVMILQPRKGSAFSFMSDCARGLRIKSQSIVVIRFDDVDEYGASLLCKISRGTLYLPGGYMHVHYKSLFK